MRAVNFLCLCLVCSLSVPQSGVSNFAEKKAPITVQARLKTDEVETKGDAADDSCTFINVDKPKNSLIIGTDKKSGLAVYNLEGKRVQQFNDGHQNNVDLRYEFPLFGEDDDDEVALVSAGNRTTNTIDFYYVNSKAKELKRLEVGVHSAGLEVYGTCMYRSPRSKTMYVFVTSKDGTVMQWEVSARDKKLQLRNVRSFDVGTQVEGCVVDDELGRLYVGEEAIGIWQYGADPKDGSARKQIDHTGPSGNLVADVEGLTLYRLKDQEGYLLASSQGENAFNIYDRKNGSFIGKFVVEFEGKKIEDTDGIDVVSHRLGKNFPAGLLVVQDGNKQNEKQSFKYISWDELASQFSPPLKRSKRDPLVD